MIYFVLIKSNKTPFRCISERRAGPRKNNGIIDSEGGKFIEVGQDCVVSGGKKGESAAGSSDSGKTIKNLV